jgi:hypothetical protein
VRRRIPDLRVNSIMKYKDPKLYILEMVLLEYVKKEVVPELLVELVDGEGVYLCCKESIAFRCLRGAYHVERETVDEEILCCVREFLEEFTREVKQSRECTGMDEDNPFQLVAQDILEEGINEIGRETLQVFLILIW